MKGAWESLIYYVNREKTEGIRKLAAEAQWFEDRMPWDPKYRKQGVPGAAAFRAGVGSLLAEVQHIKAQGDYPAAKKLLETYGVTFDPKLRDQVVARVEKLNLPSYSGFVMPKLEPVVGPDGRLTDVKISYPQDLTAQMLEYSGKRR